MLQKIEKYRRTVERLREALSDFTQNPDSTVIRDGVIQRFEFTFELAWKSLREYLEDQGADMSGIVLSKQVFKAAYAAQAAQVVADISNRYIGPLAALAERYLEA